MDRETYFFAERPSSGIAGLQGGWIAGNGSEGTRPALPLAGPVPEWWNGKAVFIESPHGQRLAARACSRNLFRGPLSRGMATSVAPLLGIV